MDGRKLSTPDLCWHDMSRENASPQEGRLSRPNSLAPEVLMLAQRICNTQTLNGSTSPPRMAADGSNDNEASD